LWKLNSGNGKTVKRACGVKGGNNKKKPKKHFKVKTKIAKEKLTRD
jgi:hypothetical protein